MAVRAEDVFPVRALGLVLAVVAEAGEHRAQRLEPRSEHRAAAVVFKADDHAAARAVGAAELVVADHALLRADRAEIEQPDEVAALPVEGLVVVAHHLIAAADRQEDDAVVRRGADLVGAAAVEVLEQDLLLEVLAAADEHEVKAGKGFPRAEGQARDGGAEPAPDEALLQAHDVAAVAVEVQHVGVQMADLQFHSLSPPRTASCRGSGAP